MFENVDQHLEFALSQHQLGHGDVARKAYEAILQQQPQCSQALHLLGLLEFQEGNQQAALDRIGRAIAIDPNQAVYLNNYGAVLLSAGRVAEASGYFQRAVAIRSDYADAQLNLGRAQWSLAQLAAAAESFRRTIELAPQNLDAYRLLAALLYDAGNVTKSIEVYQAAIAIAPTDAALWNDLGSAQLSLDQNDQAAHSFQTASELAPQVGEIWFNRGAALEQLLDIEEARDAVRTAIRLQPKRSEWQLREALLCPPVFSSAAAVEQFCENLLFQLKAMHGNLVSVDEERLLAAGIHPPLAIAFQGRDTRQIKEELAAAIRPHVRPLAARGSASKPRVGFVVTLGHSALFERCTGGLIEQMDNGDFDLFILCSTACTRSLRKRIQRDDVAYVDFPDNFAAAASAIAAAKCDVLYHWEVGSDSLNFLLPLARLAPVQCTSWGTQTTSGLSEVDYYLSSHAIESPDADQYCTETLIRLPSLPTYQRRIPAPMPAHRSEFGLADEARLYLCPQNLLKIHPDQDALFNAILDGDRAGVIVLKETGSEVPGERLRQRFRETLKQNAERVHFVPWLASADYYRLLTVADVILDPLHYSAGSSAYDFFSLGLPVVSLPGSLNVSRYTQACYQVMGFPDLIASDKDDYVARAIRVATNRDFREYTCREIRQRSDCLFETRSAAADLKEFFQTVLARIRSAGG